MSARVPSAARRVRPRRGSVILFVLGIVLLAAFLLAQLIARASGEFLVASRQADAAVLRAEAYSALEVTLAVLADFRAAEGTLRSPGEPWGDPLGHAGYEPAPGLAVTVAFEDETGKLPLATAEAPTLQRYAEAVGVMPADAERLADALLAWTQAGHLAAFPDTDPARYRDGRVPYAPPHRPVRSLAELRAIAVARDLFFDEAGQWTDLGERFCADLSLHRFGQVNVNTARPAVLVALGLAPEDAIALVESTAPGRGEARVYANLMDAAAGSGADLAGGDVGTAIECLRIRITVRRGATGLQLEAVIGTGPGGGATAGAAAATEPNALPVEPRASTSKRVDYPFRVLELRELPALPF